MIIKEQMKTKTKELPKWFNGEHYAEGSEVTNPFSGESFYLDRTELSMYDFIMGCSITFEQGGLFTDCDPKLVRDLRLLLDIYSPDASDVLFGENMFNFKK